jgi:hypothetical protein
LGSTRPQSLQRATVLVLAMLGIVSARCDNPVLVVHGGGMLWIVSFFESRVLTGGAGERGVRSIFGRQTSTPGLRTATALVVAAMVSVQSGAAIAATVFAEVGPLGAAWMRLCFAAVILWGLARPRLRGRSRTDLGAALALGGVSAVLSRAVPPRRWSSWDPWPSRSSARAAGPSPCGPRWPVRACSRSPSLGPRRWTAAAWRSPSSPPPRGPATSC